MGNINSEPIIKEIPKKLEMELNMQLNMQLNKKEVKREIIEDNDIFKKILNISNDIFTEYNSLFLKEDFCSKFSLIFEKKLSKIDIKLLKELYSEVNSNKEEEELIVMLQYLPNSSDKFVDYENFFKDTLDENFYYKNIKIDENIILNKDKKNNNNIVSHVKYNPKYIEKEHVNKLLDSINNNKIYTEKLIEKIGGATNNRVGNNNENNNENNNSSNNNNNENNNENENNNGNNNGNRNNSGNNNLEEVNLNKVNNHHNKQKKLQVPGNKIKIGTEQKLSTEINTSKASVNQSSINKASANKEPVNKASFNKAFVNESNKSISNKEKIESKLPNHENKESKNNNTGIKEIETKTNRIIVENLISNKALPQVIENRTFGKLLKYYVPRTYGQITSFCNNNKDRCELSKKELCQSISENLIVKNNIIAAILTFIPYKNNEGEYEGGLCYKKFLNLDSCKVCLPDNYRNLIKKEKKDVIPKILEKADYLDKKMCKERDGFFYELTSQQRDILLNKMKNITPDKLPKELERNPNFKYNLLYADFTLNLKKTYFENLNSLIEILNQLKSKLIFSNKMLNEISNKTKSIIDNTYNICHMIYVYAIYFLINIDIKENNNDNITLIDKENLNELYKKIKK